MRRELSSSLSDEELNNQYKSEKLDIAVSKLINKQAKREQMRRIARRAGKAVASITIILALMGTVLFSVDATRIRIINAVLDWRQTHVVIAPQIEGSSTRQNDGINLPSYLPQGFYEDGMYTAGSVNIVVYTNSDGQSISFRQSLAEGTVLSVDSEYAEYEIISISGYEAHLFISKAEDTTNKIVWIAGDMIYHLSSHISHYELVMMAESIDYN